LVDFVLVLNILRFLMGKREKAVSGDFDPDDKWFCDEFVQPLGKPGSDAE
jgi:hypothetical protein